MEANSALAGSNWERGDHRTGRVHDAADTAGAQRIRLNREYRNRLLALVKKSLA